MSYALTKVVFFLKRIPKTYYYPILLFIPFFILILLGLNGSSIGTFNEAIDGNAGENRIYGSNRWIRSDEYLAATPIVLSQEIQGNPEINEAIGTGINLGIQTNIPVGNFFSLFKIPSWFFFLTDDINIAFSFFWWAKIYILAIGSYLLLMELSNGKILLSAFGSLIFIFTPFAHWWSNFEFIGYASFILFSFFRLLKSNNKIEILAMSVIFYFFSISFALLLYPPFQVMIVWSSIFLALGFILNNFFILKKDTFFYKRIILLGILLLAIAFTIGIFIYQYRDIIDIMTNTSYPGIRFFSGGGLSLSNHFNGFYNILLQSDFNGVPIGQRNQSEASNFFLLYPFVILYLAISRLLSIKKKKKVDYILLSMSLWLTFLAIWSYFPLPEFLSKFTLLSQVPPSRIPIGLGFSSYILCFYFLSQNIKHSKKSLILSGIIAISVWIAVFYLGLYFYTYSPQYFYKPVFLSPEIKIALVSGFFFISSYLLLTKKVILFCISLFFFSVLSTFSIHPLYKGVDSMNKTEFAKKIMKYDSDKNNRWVVYGDHRFAQYIIGNGGYVLNGIHYYPMFDLWKIIDPKEEYKDVYNRYAHVHFDNAGDTEPLLKLIYADQISVNMHPCDERLKTLHVRYFLLPEKGEFICLKYRDTVNTQLRGPLYIYERFEP